MNWFNLDFKTKSNIFHTSFFVFFRILCPTFFFRLRPCFVYAIVFAVCVCCGMTLWNLLHVVCLWPICPLVHLSQCLLLVLCCIIIPQFMNNFYSISWGASFLNTCHQFNFCHKNLLHLLSLVDSSLRINNLLSGIHFG